MNKCKCCGKENFETSYLKGPKKTRMDEKGYCFKCALWDIRSEKKCHTIIDGGIYSVGKWGDGGMAGRIFNIKYNDGREVKTNSLWFGGDIPERFIKKMPDNAVFLGGAGACKNKKGETLCFNSSSQKIK